MAGWLNVIPYWAKEAGVKIVTGSYVGTGKYGSANPNSLTFEFEPKMVVIGADSDPLYGWYLWFRDAATGMVLNLGSSGGINACTITWSGKTINWFSPTSDSSRQLNANRPYKYIAIG